MKLLYPREQYMCSESEPPPEYKILDSHNSRNEIIEDEKDIYDTQSTWKKSGIPVVFRQSLLPIIPCLLVRFLFCISHVISHLHI